VAGAGVITGVRGKADHRILINLGPI